ncbi:MAG TPA: hypothetical protein VFZ40_17615 [Pyrinomonadaceae bacterium]
MRKLFIFLFVLLFGSVDGQKPPIGNIDFYGLRSVSEQQARQALQIKDGDLFPASPEEARRRLEAIPNVQQARLNLVCCEAGKAILYVGIKEKGAPSLQFRSAPKGAIRLPETIVQAGEALDDAFTEGITKGDAGEDDSQGHALFSYPKARAIQERFITFAARDLKLLRAVLHESGDAQHRALAAEIIAYAANKRDVVADLVYGMRDPESAVRNNSMRALAIIAGFARQLPKQRIEVPAEPFVEMLNSIVWTDRNKGSCALYEITESRDPAVLSKLREQALPSLIEMSRWKSPGHALCPFFLLGRVGNISEDEISRAWASGNRERLIETVSKRVESK